MITEISKADAALAYAAIGVAVFPIWPIRDGACACGAADCKSPGKHPIPKFTPKGVLNASRDPAVIAHWWGQMPDANIAMPTAENYVTVIDIDPRNGGNETWDDIVSKLAPLPDTLHARTGGGGEHFYFTIPKSVKLRGKLGAGVDIKGGNGYVLIEPSVTKGIYLWTDGCSPLDGQKPAEMPKDLLALCCAEITTDQPQSKAAPRSATVLPESTVAEIRAALMYIPSDDYSDWVNVGLSLSELGGVGRGLWLEWSALSDKFDAQHAAKKWATFASSGERTYLSIFEQAQRCGWVNPLGKVSQQIAELTKQYETLPPIPQVIADTAAECVPFPVPELNDLARWVAGRAGLRKVDHAIQAATLSIAAHAASRRYVTDLGDPSRLYLASVSDSTGDFRPVMNAVRDFIEACNARRSARTDRFMSTHKLHGALFSCPAMLYLTSDWGDQIAFARRQPSGETANVFSAIANLFEAGDIQFSDPALAGLAKGDYTDDMPVLRHPCLSILTSLSVPQLTSTFRQSEIGRGAASQLLYCKQSQAEFFEQDQASPSYSAIESFRTLRGISTFGDDASLADLSNGNAYLHPRLIKVAFARNPREDYSAFDLSASGSAGRALSNHARMQYRRLCLVLAAWAYPKEPEITPAIQDWARDFIKASIGQTAELIGLYAGNEEGKMSVYDLVLAEIVKARSEGISEGRIVHLCWGFRNLTKEKRKDLLEQLEHDDEIFFFKGCTTKAGGRPAARYVATRFAKKDAAL